MAYDRETETESTVISGGRTVRLAEAIEDVWQKILLDAHAGVIHDDLYVRIDSLQGDLDQPALASKLHAIREQVPNNLLQSFTIAEHWSNVRLEQYFQANTLCFGSGLNTLCRRFDHFLKVAGDELQAQLAGDDA